ncbi:unnamed protein product, partial [marine sediment metagenome]
MSNFAGLGLYYNDNNYLTLLCNLFNFTQYVVVEQNVNISPLGAKATYNVVGLTNKPFNHLTSSEYGSLFKNKVMVTLARIFLVPLWPGFNFTAILIGLDMKSFYMLQGKS